MKNILILSLLIILVSCKKKLNQVVSKTQNTNSVTSISTNTILSNYERVMVGNWKMSTHQSYASSTLLITETYTNTVDCHVRLDSLISPNFSIGPYPNAKQSLSGLYTCNPTSAYWFVTDSILTLTGQEYRIQKLTFDTLIITEGRAYIAYNQKYTLWK